MKTKISKNHILLVAIMLLLVFVVCFNTFNTTNSWLKDSDQIEFTVNVNDISIAVKQGTREIENDGTGKIYLGTNFIEADVKCDFEDVLVVNNETAKGYYIRCQVFARIGEKVYNINNCIENDLYKSSDGWMYYTEITNDVITTTPKQMEGKDLENSTKGVVTIMESLTLPSLLEDNVDDSLDVYFSDFQGQLITLHLYIEGSAIAYTIV